MRLRRLLTSCWYYQWHCKLTNSAAGQASKVRENQFRSWAPSLNETANYHKSIALFPDCFNFFSSSSGQNACHRIIALVAGILVYRTLTRIKTKLCSPWLTVHFRIINGELIKYFIYAITAKTLGNLSCRRDWHWTFSHLFGVDIDGCNYHSCVFLPASRVTEPGTQKVWTMLSPGLLCRVIGRYDPRIMSHFSQQ